MRLEVIQGGAVRPLPVLNAAVKASLATRFLVHGAKLSTLAWETGHTQHRLCEVIVEQARAEGIRVGRRQARFAPPMGRVV